MSTQNNSSLKSLFSFLRDVFAAVTVSLRMDVSSKVIYPLKNDSLNRPLLL